MPKNEYGLTEKQEIFCQEYIKNFNGAEAARIAGYKDNRPDQQAHENLSKPDISKRINDLKADRMKKLGIDSTWVLEKAKLHYDEATNLSDAKLRIPQIKMMLETIGKHCEIQAFDGTNVKVEINTDKIDEISLRIQGGIEATSPGEDSDIPQEADVEGPSEAETMGPKG